MLTYLYRKSNVWGSLHEIKDAILATSRKSNEDINSPTLSGESSTSQTSSNQSSPYNSDSSGKLGPQLTDMSQSPSKPPVSTVILRKGQANFFSLSSENNKLAYAFQSHDNDEACFIKLINHVLRVTKE